MKKIIEVKVAAKKGKIETCRTDILCVGIFSGEKKLDAANAALNKKLGGLIERVIKLGDFKGDELSTKLIYTSRKIAAERLMLVGLGEKKKARLDTIRKAAACAANQAVSMKVETLALALHKAFAGIIDPQDAARAITEGVYFGSFRYDEFVTSTENGRAPNLNVQLIEPDAIETKKLQSGCEAGTIVGEAQSFARALTNKPGNVINPPALADEAAKLAKQTKGLTCTILAEKQLAEKKMGGILAVGKGSNTPPRFIILRYNGAAKSDNLPTVALIGKAITFDSGGISIKPSANMEAMKLDKTGGISVMAAMRAAALMKLPINLYGLIPCAENLPSGTSYRPGDIITTYSGKTVEIHSTDAEGRMILCDAIHYAGEENCDIILDIATLTGSCIVALGKYMGGLFGNDDDLVKQLLAAAEESGERLWHLPSGDDYAKEMKSKIADLKNVGSKWGGACTGAAFLGQFIDKAKWAHLDIAGVDDFEESTATSSVGSSGFGVRLLTTFLVNLVKEKGQTL